MHAIHVGLTTYNEGTYLTPPGRVPGACALNVLGFLLFWVSIGSMYLSGKHSYEFTQKFTGISSTVYGKSLSGLVYLVPHTKLRIDVNLYEKNIVWICVES